MLRIAGCFDQEWEALLSRLGVVPHGCLAEFAHRCDERSRGHPDKALVDRTYRDVEAWLGADGWHGLVATYPSRIVEGDRRWSLKRAVLTAAVLLEEDTRRLEVEHGLDDTEVDDAFGPLVDEAFDALWAMLLAATGGSPGAAPVVRLLASTSTSPAR